MFAARMIRLIDAHAHKISEELIRQLEQSNGCHELVLRVPKHELAMRSREIYHHLNECLLAKTPAEIEDRYVGIGMRRADQGVPFSELLFAFALTKDCLWEHLEQDGLFEDPMELIGDLHLLRSVGQFFDRMAHATAVGYETVYARKAYLSRANSPEDVLQVKAS
jgi:hypothetical protein